MEIITIVAISITIVAISIVMIHKSIYRRKAYFLKIDTDQEGNDKVIFAEKPKSYRIVSEDKKTKVHIPGLKKKIPFDENQLNPSHHKNWGGVIAQKGDVCFFCDLKIEDVDESKKLLLKPIPYDQKVNYAETLKQGQKKFTPMKSYLIAGGIFVVAMIIVFLMFYFAWEKLPEIANKLPDPKQMETVAETIKELAKGK